MEIDKISEIKNAAHEILSFVEQYDGMFLDAPSLRKVLDLAKNKVGNTIQLIDQSSNVGDAVKHLKTVIKVTEAVKQEANKNKKDLLVADLDLKINAAKSVANQSQ